MLLRIYNAAKKYLFKDTRYFITYSFRLFQDNYKLKCNFRPEEELIKELKSGKSVIRLGDGEIGLIHHLPIHYQKYSDQIRGDFIDIIKDYSNNSHYLLMIPIFINQTNKDLKLQRAGLLQCWLPFKVTYELLFNKEARYYDAHLFYKDNKIRDIIIPYALTKRILVVTCKDNIDNIKKTFFDKDITSYIEAPSRDAYDYSEIIEKNIKDYIKNNNFNKKDFIIFMSAGLSKTIIYKLSKEGYQLLDIGKGIEGYTQQTSLEELI